MNVFGNQWSSLVRALCSKSKWVPVLSCLFSSSNIFFNTSLETRRGIARLMVEFIMVACSSLGLFWYALKIRNLRHSSVFVKLCPGGLWKLSISCRYWSVDLSEQNLLAKIVTSYSRGLSLYRLTLFGPGGAIMAPLPWICLPLLHGQGYVNQTSWLCSFPYLPGPRKPVLVFVFQKIEKNWRRKFLGVLEH